MGRNLFGQFLSKLLACPKVKLFGILLFCCLWVGFAIFYIPVRNVVFRFLITDAWRDVETNDLIQMRYMSDRTPEDFRVSSACDVMVRLNDTLGQTTLDRQTVIKNNNVTVEQTLEMLSRGLGCYLPVLDVDQKMSALRLYLALAHVLEKHKVPYFLTAGSMLGVVRHGGFIPWDDDFDIGVDVVHMKETRRALSCITGTELSLHTSFHWKFRFAGQWFPFIDIFIYDKDERYLWALTKYITITFVYRRQNVFPLTTAQFEGSVAVPIPGKALEVVKRIYSYSDCVAYTTHKAVKWVWLTHFPNGYSTSNVPCQTLSEFYNISNLDG